MFAFNTMHVPNERHGAMSMLTAAFVNAAQLRLRLPLTCTPGRCHRPYHM